MQKRTRFDLTLPILFKYLEDRLYYKAALYIFKKLGKDLTGPKNPIGIKTHNNFVFVVVSYSSYRFRARK